MVRREQVAPVAGERGCVVWLTGLPSAGKTTRARRLADELASRHRAVEGLDGDEVRRRLTRGLGFSPFATDREHGRVLIGPRRVQVLRRIT